VTARAKKPAATVRAPSPRPAAAEVDPAAAEAFILEGRGRAPAGRPGTSPDAPATAPRAPQGSKVLVARKSGAVRRRMTVYLSEDTAERLKAWCETQHREASASIDDAINEWLDQQVKPFG
jgi:hypothetical protein